MTTVLISRSPVAEIERSADGISTFHGVFTTFPLYGFSDQDMDEFYGALTDYDIFPDEEMKGRLAYYCGRIPYLLSMFAREMAEDQMQQRTVDADRVDEIFARRLRGDIEDFYITLRNRFQEDHQLEAMLGALFGPMTLEEQRNVSVLEQRGYLSEDENGYYSMTRDFTIYLELQQTNIPLFETLIRGGTAAQGDDPEGVSRHGGGALPGGQTQRGGDPPVGNGPGPLPERRPAGISEFPGKDLHPAAAPSPTGRRIPLSWMGSPWVRWSASSIPAGRTALPSIFPRKAATGGRTGWRSSTRSATLSCTPTDT